MSDYLRLFWENMKMKKMQGICRSLLQEKVSHPLQIHLHCSSIASKVFENAEAAKNNLLNKIHLSFSLLLSANDPTSHFPNYFPTVLSFLYPNVQSIFSNFCFLKHLFQFSFLKILNNPIVMLCILRATLGALKGESTFE